MSPLQTIGLVLTLAVVLAVFVVVGCWVVDLYEWSRGNER